jgi:ferric-dicitrate binding protein FerR (iron transport regulator)
MPPTIQGSIMSHPLDAGHRQLFEAECSALSNVWRRAAEAQHDQPAAQPALIDPPRQRRGVQRAFAWATVVPLAGVALFVTLFVLGSAP